MMKPGKMRLAGLTTRMGSLKTWTEEKSCQAKACKGGVLIRNLKNEVGLCEPDLSDARQDVTANSCENENKTSGSKRKWEIC
jgi:hypothetical protein